MTYVLNDIYGISDVADLGYRGGASYPNDDDDDDDENDYDQWYLPK
jgi:hypothetical protein